MKLPYSSNGYIIDLSWVKGKARNVIVQAMLKKASELGLKYLPDVSNLIDAPYITIGCAGSTVSYCEETYEYLITKRKNCKEVSVNDFLECKGFEKYPSESSNVCDLKKTSTFIIGGNEYAKVAMSSSHRVGDKETVVNLVLVDKKNERNS